MQHLHEEGGVGRIALHVLEVEEVLAALGHGPHVGQQRHQLVVLVLNGKHVSHSQTYTGKMTKLIVT